jgi:hypothetical protein
MQIRIIETDQERADMWFNSYVGQTFPVIGDLSDGIPRQWTVDVSRLVESGEMAASSRGLAYVPKSFAEEIDD